MPGVLERGDPPPLLDRIRVPLGELMAGLTGPERAGVARYLAVAERAFREALDEPGPPLE
ncbi:hypothetical protein [Pseudonocardia sp. NPDC046786]|uniref:hypothetical protein n=1 Tax=Pseudonocardia sp. NPDC046786 TaxID=3155471 RepID=UPI0033E7D248